MSDEQLYAITGFLARCEELHQQDRTEPA